MNKKKLPKLHIESIPQKSYEVLGYTHSHEYGFYHSLQHFLNQECKDKKVISIIPPHGDEESYQIVCEVWE